MVVGDQRDVIAETRNKDKIGAGNAAKATWYR